MNTPNLRPPNVSSNRNTAAPNSTNSNPQETVAVPKGTFIAAPYLQIGTGNGTPTLCWTTPEIKDTAKKTQVASNTPVSKGVSAGNSPTKAGAKTPPTGWKVEIRGSSGAEWTALAKAPESRRIAPPGIAPEIAYRVAVEGVKPGEVFDYRISEDGKPVFSARATAPKGNGTSARFVLFGDCGVGEAAQKRIAYQASLVKPDLVAITGDIVYDFGRASEYRTKFFPIYNAETASEKTGAPLLRSVPFIASPGNHDIAYTNLSKYPDGLAYFYYWDVPRNGPPLKPKDPGAPPVRGNDAAEKALITGAGDAYPRSANYSFDSGNVHWLVLDSNYYVDWSRQDLRAWVDKDLASARTPWKFVVLHIPPFHSSKQHQDEQFMRVLCEVFEKNGVDIVWSGHVHNYQRTFPVQFTAVRGLSGSWVDDKGRVSGQWKLDTVYDGKKNTRPGAPIYVVTGAGGAPIYNADFANKPDQWQEFTAKYIGGHSFSVVDIEGQTLTVRQISDTGKELDKFVITK